LGYLENGIPKFKLYVRDIIEIDLDLIKFSEQLNSQIFSECQ